MLEKINKSLNKFREEMKDLNLNLEGRILVFFISLVIMAGAILMIFIIIYANYAFPKIIIPIEITLIVLWNLFNRFLQGKI